MCIVCVFLVVFLKNHVCSLWSFSTGFNLLIFIVGCEGQIPASVLVKKKIRFGTANNLLNEGLMLTEINYLVPSHNEPASVHNLAK